MQTDKLPLPERSAERDSMKPEATYDSQPSDRILRVLSDKARARLAASSTRTHLAKGDEYLDLNDLDRGVQRATGIAEPTGKILPRKAIALTVWRVILARISEDLLTSQAPPPLVSHAASSTTVGLLASGGPTGSKPG